MLLQPTLQIPEALSHTGGFCQLPAGAVLQVLHSGAYVGVYESRVGLYSYAYHIPQHYKFRARLVTQGKLDWTKQKQIADEPHPQVDASSTYIAMSNKPLLDTAYMQSSEHMSKTNR